MADSDQAEHDEQNEEVTEITDQSEQEANEAVEQEDIDADVVEDTDEDTTEDEPQPSVLKQKLSRFIGWYKANKRRTVPLTLAALLVIILAVPFSRYKVLGLVIKKDFQVVVIDSKSNLPVSGVDINLGSVSAKTDGEGKATLKHISVGSVALKLTKKYYKDLEQNVTVPLRTQKQPQQIRFEATGRQVPIHVTNKITGKSVAGVTIKAADSEFQTDANGEAQLVLPPNEQKVSAVFSLKDYNSLTTNVTVSSLFVDENNIKLVPAGKVYFLSKRTGKIDVMKADLDGSNQQAVIKASGNEDDRDTILLSTRDWRYLAFKTRRSGSNGKLFVIDTTTDTLKEVDGAKDVGVNFVGWSGHNFVYQTTREKVAYGKANRVAIKSYSADSGQITQLIQNTGEYHDEYDNISEDFGTIHIIGNKLVFAKTWGGNTYDEKRTKNKKFGIYSIAVTGGSFQALKEFPLKAFDEYGQYINSTQSEPGEVYFEVTLNEKVSYYAYENGAVQEDKDMNSDKFYRPYPTFLASPSDDNTFWYESRDGKNTLFVGDTDGNKGVEIAKASEYKPYGWYSDNYVLVSKNESELYVMPSNGQGTTGQVIKITDYHRPDSFFYNYGGGYGGI